MDIHPTAEIASTAKIGKDVKIGAYAVIEDHVEIGDNCLIESHAFIRSYVKMGSNNIVHPFAVIGGLPQDISFDKTLETYTVIGDDNVFREGFTIHRSTRAGKSTQVGSKCYFMSYTHIGHDCVVGNGCIFVTYSGLAGFVEVGDNVVFGGGAMVHQFCRIGSLAMVAGGALISKDVLPFSMVAGTPVRHYRLNLIGLRRQGIKGERLKSLSEAFLCLRKAHDLTALELPQTPENKYLQKWIASSSKRGIYRFVSDKLKEKE